MKIIFEDKVYRNTISFSQKSLDFWRLRLDKVQSRVGVKPRPFLRKKRDRYFELVS